MQDFSLKADFNGRAVLRRGSTGIRLLGFRVPAPSGSWISVLCECYVLSGRSLYDGPISRPEDCYRVWCVEMSLTEEPHGRKRRPTRAAESG